MADTDPGLLAQVLGRVAYEFSAMQPMLPTYMHLIFSALFPIYTGAHASLTRPSTAAKPTKKEKNNKRRRTQDDDEDSDSEDEEDEERVMEGLSPTDAILMPLFAGAALASLYFLIKWLENPALLNKILNAYFAVFGVFSVSRLVTDMLDIGHSLIFPHRYARGGALYHVNSQKSKAIPMAGNTKDKQPRESPLPGFLASIPLSDRARNWLWADRALPRNKWTLKLYMHRVFAGKFKVGPHGIVGGLVGLATVAYFNLIDKPWYLTNLLGFGFSYGALQLMSPTSFTTGSLILSALFFYDIYFVFFTPMMVTVAKSLDVPIKLMFPRPAATDDPTAAISYAMLGLGDVVLPGIMIGLALRFDLYLFYLRRQKRIPAVKSGEADTIEKPKYHSLAGRWSDHFWTHSLTGQPLWVGANVQESEPGAHFTFPKTYFKAGLVGYVLGMLATLGVMMVWDHAQPALLYLVPGVLGSLWLTALVRGEIGLMWDYTEEIEDENSDNKVPDDKAPNLDAKSSEDASKVSKSQNNSSSTTNALPKSGPKVQQAADVKRIARTRSDRQVFSLSIEATWQLKQPLSVQKERATTVKATADGEKQDMEERHNWAPSKANPNQDKGAEPAGKRVRLK
ncbi:signal peptide peptidase [Pyrenophora seminiperda CCB06]|uniref:Signal peptide peptidase n=1 Tax=Pyrenophora seminiperda CCB06 TaxID=1302712 RepID=A0A3M7MAB8_9PLEO|nr:signal peptide peptidase [Pyrenophora seminiperda CCB06]